MQFGAVVYNVEQLNTKFRQDDEQVKRHMATTITNIMYGPVQLLCHFAF
jgi:hypothetical protein